MGLRATLRMLELRLWFAVACPAAAPALIAGCVTSVYGGVGGAWVRGICGMWYVSAHVFVGSMRFDPHNRYTEIAGMYATTKSSRA